MIQRKKDHQNRKKYHSRQRETPSKKAVVFERIGISPSVCILFPFDADEKSTTFASSSRKNAVLREFKSIELNFRMWFKYGLKAQKLLAQGIALGIMAISKAPCKGKSFVYCQVFESFCPYRATGLRP